MKILFFDDFKLGVLKGDSVVDVSRVVQDIPRLGSHDVIRGVIERFAELRPRLESAAAQERGVPLDHFRPLGGEVHRVATAHGEPDQGEGSHAELIDDAREILERPGGVVDVGGIAVAVTARIQRVHVEVRLQRDGQRVPRVRVAGEAVQQQQGRSVLAAPVEQAQTAAVDDEIALVRTEQVHPAPTSTRRTSPRCRM